MINGIGTEGAFSPDIEKALAHHKDKLASQDTRSVDRVKGAQKIFKDYVRIIDAMIQSQIPGDENNTVKMAEMAQLHLSMSQSMAAEEQTKAVENMDMSFRNTQVLEAANHIGKLAQVKSNTFEFDPKFKNPITYDVPTAAHDVEVTISKVEKRQSGSGMATDMGMQLRQVAVFKAPNHVGKNNTVWDGKIPDPKKQGSYITAPKGTYHVNVVLKDKAGKEIFDTVLNKPIRPDVYVTGVVTGAAWDKGKPCIRIGDSIHGIDSIVGFEEGHKIESGKKGRVPSAYTRAQSLQQELSTATRRIGTDLAGVDIPGFKTTPYSSRKFF